MKNAEDGRGVAGGAQSETGRGMGENDVIWLGLLSNRCCLFVENMVKGQEKAGYKLGYGNNLVER